MINIIICYTSGKIAFVKNKKLSCGGSIPLPAAAFGVLRHPLMGDPQVGTVARIKQLCGGTHTELLKSSNPKCCFFP